MTATTVCHQGMSIGGTKTDMCDHVNTLRCVSRGQDRFASFGLVITSISFRCWGYFQEQELESRWVLDPHSSCSERSLRQGDLASLLDMVTRATLFLLILWNHFHATHS